MQIGIDLVELEEFKKNFQSPDALEKVFLSSELAQNKKVESLAGIFASKEAFFKALGRKVGWLEVWVEKDPSGKPKLESAHLNAGQKTSISISHSGNYAVAAVVIF